MMTNNIIYLIKAICVACIAFAISCIFWCVYDFVKMVKSGERNLERMEEEYFGDEYKDKESK